MNALTRRLRPLLAHQEGQTLTEYALILLFVALGCILAVRTFGQGVLELYQRVLEAWPS
ncbi:MAG TPA: Flp family type IVb pilin [Dehalococcoidia bacterium]